MPLRAIGPMATAKEEKDGRQRFVGHRSITVGIRREYVGRLQELGEYAGEDHGAEHEERRYNQTIALRG